MGRATRSFDFGSTRMRPRSKSTWWLGHKGRAFHQLVGAALCPILQVRSGEEAWIKSAGCARCSIRLCHVAAKLDRREPPTEGPFTRIRRHGGYRCSGEGEMSAMSQAGGARLGAQPSPTTPRSLVSETLTPTSGRAGQRGRDRLHALSQAVRNSFRQPWQFLRGFDPEQAARRDEKPTARRPWSPNSTTRWSSSS